eukprot:CAMPEP_0119547856 /NCGR_PEP_ID=MMETSP1352-20130426/1888_1 /TAXON_ID=265584 /ORGANISM="Stauroneis constricta, Strain CCMP1120" /LENGTH=501 /DNA_ID=CAMNT_0007592917 /DNA_START=114 /DNA_END=1619 /DNA_ORIENTATION=+
MIDPADVNDLQLEDVADYSADYAEKDFPSADGNNLQNPEESTEKVHYRRARIMALMRANKWFILVVAIVLAVLIGVISAVGGGSKKSSSSSSSGSSSSRSPVSQPPITVDPKTIDEKVLDALMVKLIGFYEDNSLEVDNLKDDSLGTTPQKQAYWWLASEDGWKNLSDRDLIQRYALASFYYATNSRANAQETSPGPWVDAYKWLSDEHTCDWKGIVCDPNKEVTAIKMSENNLSGSLPMELSLIAATITELDLTTNLIHMEHKMYDVFESFENLETLLMDDNYLQTYNSGLPWQFKRLVNIEKIRLSYNLLQGQMESTAKVFEHWGKLTHLEIESNYLTGTMPTEIASLSNLVYLYMRRNDMTFNLDFLKSDKLVNLFALWLDNNDITGTIPTEIGNLDTLVSVSITNSTSLGGPIPSEIGNLSELRRLWLYKNKLTGEIPTQIAKLGKLEVFEVHNNLLSGDMPDGICSNVNDADYVNKAVTSDCKTKIGCDCCTQCYD